MIGQALAALAGRQHGVVSAEQLRRLGLDKFAVNRRIKSGWLHPLHRGVYAVGRKPVTRPGRYLAAVLACGPGAALSHRSAADLWGIRPSATRIEVTVPHGQTGAAGIEVHISRMQHADDFTELEQVPVTSVRRTLLDISSYVPKRDLARAVDRAERLDLFDLQAVSELLLRTNGRRGVAALGAAIAEWQPRHTRSELEDRFADLVRGASLETPLLNTLVEGERGVHEVDAYWPSSALVVQLDGFAYHRTRRDRERDAAADADLELAGNRVVRLTWGDVVDYPRRTLRRLGRWISGV